MTPTPQIQSEAERVAHLIYASLIPKDDPVPRPISGIIVQALLEARQAALEEAAKISEDAEYDCCGSCAKEIRALATKPTARGWQPIETAPNETFILAYGTTDLCGWYDGINMGVARRRGTTWFDNGAEELVKPTHWMPLPKPPVKGEP